MELQNGNKGQSDQTAKLDKLPSLAYMEKMAL